VLLIDNRDTAKLKPAQSRKLTTGRGTGAPT